MNVGIIGSGGREHAITHSIKSSKNVENIYCIPGNAGTNKIAKNIEIRGAKYGLVSPVSLKTNSIFRAGSAIAWYNLNRDGSR